MAISFVEIKQRYDQERRAQQRPTTVNDLPFTYAAITPEWLTAVLAREHPAAAALSYRLGPPLATLKPFRCGKASSPSPAKTPASPWPKM